VYLRSTWIELHVCWGSACSAPSGSWFAKTPTAAVFICRADGEAARGEVFLETLGIARRTRFLFAGVSLRVLDQWGRVTCREAG